MKTKAARARLEPQAGNAEPYYTHGRYVESRLRRALSRRLPFSLRIRNYRYARPLS